MSKSKVVTISCSNCRFFPFCRILREITKLDDCDSFIKHDAKESKSSRIANLCKHFEVAP